VELVVLQSLISLIALLQSINSLTAPSAGASSSGAPSIFCLSKEVDLNSALSRK